MSINVIYVNINSPSDGNGSSWKTAYNNLQTALNSAVNGNQIWVARGTYVPSQGYDVLTGGQVPVSSPPFNATFNIHDGVKIYGGFNGTENSLIQRNFKTNPTILSGDLGSGNNVYHVVLFYHTDASTLLDGFTVTGGMTNGMGFNTVGAGTFINGSNGALCNPTIKNCIVTNNFALGGAASFIYGENGEASPTFENVEFSNNLSVNGGNGGAVFIDPSNNGKCDPVFNKCVFSDNSAQNAGGALFIFCNGGDSDSVFYDCVFSNNSAKNNGAIVYNNGTNGGKCNTSFVNCAMANNSVTSDDGNGAIFNNGSCSTNCMNVTFFNNSANSGSIMNASGPSDTTMTNCILWDTTTSSSDNLIVLNDGATVSITYSDITGGWLGQNNINQDPLFFNKNNLIGSDGVWATNDDGLILQKTSPCLRTGTPVNAPSTDIIGNPSVPPSMGCYGTFKRTKSLSICINCTWPLR